ncbi:MAG: SsrA-binding protein SmpB [Candidatus Kerfeldbacteria bacterium]|nr:SsrA-binding protein SmpB [Candidatus Kerfeldbacteria bacterium]
MQGGLRILEKLEAGVVLTGQEVKSAKLGGISLQGSYARPAKNEMFLLNAHIKPYQYAGKLEGYDPVQTRKLLLHRAEIFKLLSRTDALGATVIPLEAYVKKGKIKILLGLAKAKNKADKREAIKKKEADRKIRKIIAR